MEEFFEEIQDLVTIKEKHQNSAGKPVSQDFFIYICMSELHSIRTLGAEYENLVSYPIDKQQLDNSSDEENKSSTEKGENEDEGETGNASNGTTVNAVVVSNVAVNR